MDVASTSKEAIPSTNTTISTIDRLRSPSSLSLDRRSETIDFRSKQNTDSFDDDDHHSIHHIQSKPISLDIRRTISFQTPNHSVCSLSALRHSVHSIIQSDVHRIDFVLNRFPFHAINQHHLDRNQLNTESIHKRHRSVSPNARFTEHIGHRPSCSSNDDRIRFQMATRSYVHSLTVIDVSKMTAI